MFWAYVYMLGIWFFTNFTTCVNTGDYFLYISKFVHVMYIPFESLKFGTHGINLGVMHICHFFKLQLCVHPRHLERNKETKKRRKTTLMLPQAWIMVLLWFELGLWRFHGHNSSLMWEVGLRHLYLKIPMESMLRPSWGLGHPCGVSTFI